MKRLFCALFLLLTSATAQVESRFHDTVFRIPNGWRTGLVLIKKGPNDRAVRWFVGSNPGGRFEMVLVAASSESVFRRLDGAERKKFSPSRKKMRDGDSGLDERGRGGGR